MSFVHVRSRCPRPRQAKPLKIPPDMHKWRAKFAWQMIGFAIVMFLLAALMVSEAWFFRAKFLAKPVELLIPAVGLACGAVMLVRTAFMLINASFGSRKHDAKIKELEKNRPPLTLGKLREELQPEKLEQSRTSMLRMLQAMSPETRRYTEVKLTELADRYRADLGSTPEVEAELAKLEAFNREVLEELKTLN